LHPKPEDGKREGERERKEKKILARENGTKITHIYTITGKRDNLKFPDTNMSQS